MFPSNSEFKMRLLIVWWDRNAVQNFKTQCEGLMKSTQIEMTNDLSHAFNFAEHSVPEVCIVSQQFCLLPEFEIFAALLSAIGCECLIDQDVTEEGNGMVSVGSYSLSILDEAIFDVCCRVTREHNAVDQSIWLAADLDHQIPISFSKDRVLLIGASTGGIDALLQILNELPSTTPPILIVQHTGAGFAGSLIRLLNRDTRVEVKAAVDGEPLVSGCAYMSPSVEVHLGMSQTNGTKQCRLIKGDQISGHRPSVDSLFYSAVPVAPNVSAALLTGMGSDGAAGLLALRNAGAKTFVQDKESSVVHGMPSAALKLGASDHIVNIKGMAAALLNSCLPDDTQSCQRKVS